ncbi:MAG: toll/interleukin-1 receptor domain-containing protein [Bacteroidota bacterium]|nr:toll/interleukin-1 receptor domain-containing protein [Bacteroidota bacterium]
MRAFLSHISEEAPEARALKYNLEAAIPGLEVFVSAADIHLGNDWLDVINKALKKAKLVIALCSPHSVRRPWVNFESGSGWSKGLHVIPVCYKGLEKEYLPHPLGIFQAVELTNIENIQNLLIQVADQLNLTVADTYDPSLLLEQLEVERPPRTNAIGIVLCYGQREWEEGDQSIFNIRQSRTDELKGQYIFQHIDRRSDFLSPKLHQISGIILAMPWRSKLEPETISAIVEWVKAGGRLLLLGYELGDRHHDGNLSELSHHFGIDPTADIVGPHGYGNNKPYDEPVDFLVKEAEPHPFTTGIESIRLANVQTIRVDPGGVEWLRVGNNAIYRPHKDSVRYRRGNMTAPKGSFFEYYHASHMPVAVQAPEGLCGKGAVHMIGSWDLLGRDTLFGANNKAFLIRLLDWLSGKPK